MLAQPSATQTKLLCHRSLELDLKRTRKTEAGKKEKIKEAWGTIELTILTIYLILEKKVPFNQNGIKLNQDARLSIQSPLPPPLLTRGALLCSAQLCSASASGVHR